MILLACFVYLVGVVGVTTCLRVVGDPTKEAVLVGLAWPLLPFLGVVAGLMLAFERIGLWLDKR